VSYYVFSKLNVHSWKCLVFVICFLNYFLNIQPFNKFCELDIGAAYILIFS
jgi:hypothetical protein